MAYDPNEVQSYIRQAAARRGIDPGTALRVFKQESSFNPLAKNISDREESYGVTQLNAKGGLGVDALKSGIDIRNPDTWKQQVDFSLDTVAKDGWRQWYGARDVGISRWDGIGGRSGGGAADAVTQMAGGGRPPGGDDALVSAYADRGATGTKIAGPSTQAGGAVVNQIAPEQSTDLEKAMLGRALQTQVKNPWDAIGGLAQVWAANSAMKEKQAANADSLKQAVAGAGLDPDMALAAQLGGTRESLADAIVAQRQARTQAEQRQQEQNWRQEGREYEQGRDRVADERYAAEREYRTGRDAATDARANRTLDIQERAADQKAEPYKTLTADDAAKLGLPPGSYQMGPGGKIDAIGKGGVTVNNGPNEGEFAKKAAGKMADRFGNLSEGGTAAANVLQTLPQMRELLTVAPQGPIQGRLAETFPGFSSAGDAFTAGINQIAPSLRIPGSGAQSDRDMDILLGSFPRLRNDPAANTVIMDAFETKARINVQRADIANAALRGEIKPEEADRRLGELDRTSIIPEGMRNRLGITKAPESGIQPSGGRPRATNPQTGQTIEFDGKAWVPVK